MDLHLKELANSFFRGGQYKQAIQLYDKCLANDSLTKGQRVTLYSNKAQCYLKLQAFNSVLKACDAALSLSPVEVKALYRRCQAYKQMGKMKEALEDARSLMKLEPKNPAILKLARQVELAVNTMVTEAESLPSKVNTMFDVIQSMNPSCEKIEKALNNLSSLFSEYRNPVSDMIWSHTGFSEIYKICACKEKVLVVAAHRLLAQVFVDNTERCLKVLEKLTPQYFIGRILSRNASLSLENCRFLAALLESLTGLKVYEKAKEEYDRNTDNRISKVAPSKYPRYKIDPAVEEPVKQIIQQIVHVTNSYRLSPATRDYLLEILVRFVPSERGIGWSRNILTDEGVLDRLLEVAAASGAMALGGWRSRRCRQQQQQTADGANSGQFTPANLACTANTRMICACLLAKVWEDMNSDKARDVFSTSVGDFILDLFSDPFLETKVEAASVIGTLFLGPHEVGATVLLRPGILEGLLLLTKCPNALYQAIALDTIVLATHKKEQCLNVASQAVPLLQELYKSEDDGIKIRALVALCKFGGSPGSDASIHSLTTGSTLTLVKACRRLLFGTYQPDPDVANVGAVAQPKAQVDESGQLVVEQPEASGSGSDEEVEEKGEEVKPVGEVKKKHQTRNWGEKRGRGDGHPVELVKDAETVRWAIEGLAYLTLNAEAKHEVVHDSALLASLFQVASLDLKETSFALTSLLSHLANSLQQEKPDQALVDLAKFAKQHIPEQHELDSGDAVRQRRSLLIQSGLPTVLFTLTANLSDDIVAEGQKTVREMLARLYLAISETVEHRGKLVQAGAGKSLLNLTLKSNTDGGRVAAAQALARLVITADPRITFPGQRSLELIRPLLRLLAVDCDGLENFEGLLAITNLTSLGQPHRHRLMAERGIPLVDHYLFEDHPMLRRAAAECFANMSQYHAFVVSCGGSLPLDLDGEEAAAGKLPYLHSTTERVKLLVLYCGELEDILLIRAALGALATMSYDPGVIKKITDTSSWFEILQTLAGHNCCAVQHRTAHVLRNMVLHGERSLSEYLCKSNMLEVIMAMSVLPDVSAEEDLAVEMFSLYPGVSEERLRQLADSDRRATRQAALEALSCLQEYRLVEKLPSS